MASKKILFISMEMSFLVDAIINNLKEAHYEIVSVKPDIKALKECLPKCDIIILYLGNMKYISRESLIYIKAKCIEEDKALYLLGSREELIPMHSIFPENMVQKEFERPINVKDLINEFNRELNDHEKPNILIVDDDSVYLRSVHEWLHEKYHITMVNSGMNAITYLAKDTPVIFPTGQNSRENVENVIRLKPDGYLLKTMKPCELIRTIDIFFKKQKM